MSEKITDRQKNYTLFVLVLVFTSSHVDRQIMGILGQPIKESLQISDTQLGLLTGIMFAVFYATLGMPMAMWADRRNRRNLISFSVFLWSGMTALCGAAANFTQLLLLRIGVGVGEAGSNPPSHSIIADLYPKEQRATAMAVFGTGINWGILNGFLVGGWINEWYGWRTAFVVVGLPGILIAVLVRFTLTEPPRGYADAQGEKPPVVTPPPFWTVVKFMAANRVLRNIVAAGALIAFTGYASVIWVPIYLVRIHGMGTGEVGSYLALFIGVGGAIGIYLGGRLADFLSAKHGRPAFFVSVFHRSRSNRGFMGIRVTRCIRNCIRSTGFCAHSESNTDRNAISCCCDQSVYHQHHRSGARTLHRRIFQRCIHASVWY